MKHGQQTGKQCRKRETGDVWEVNGESETKKICKNREEQKQLAAVLAVWYV